LVATPNNAQEYDSQFSFHAQESDEKPVNTEFVELFSTYDQYFGHCYTSYNFGSYYVARTPLSPHDGDSATLYYGCDYNCTQESCWNHVSLVRGECTSASGYLWKMSWKDSATSATVSIAALLVLLLARLF